MTEKEKTVLEALAVLLDMTETSDWRGIHNTVADAVEKGKYGEEFETAYSGLVDRKLEERRCEMQA